MLPVGLDLHKRYTQIDQMFVQIEPGSGDAAGIEGRDKGPLPRWAIPTPAANQRPGHYSGTASVTIVIN